MKFLLLIAVIILVSCGKGSKATDEGQSFSPVANSADNNAVTKEFGELNVQIGEFSYQSEIVPWSSWWFPSRETTLFQNENERATLEKYDRFTVKYYSDNNYADDKEEELYDPATANWAGLCHAWAVASVLHPEPRNSVKLYDMKLTIADLKGLLLKTYENVQGLEIYGERYDGYHSDEYSDIFPKQFHKFLHVYLKDLRKPFLLDYDPSYPVWTVPAHKAKVKIEKESETSALVTTWLTIASPHVDGPNYVGTKNVVKTYRYRLYGNWSGDNLKVIDSEWMEESVFDHPDYVIAFPENVKRGSYNEGIVTEYVDKILSFAN